MTYTAHILLIDFYQNYFTSSNLNAAENQHVLIFMVQIWDAISILNVWNQ